MLTYSRMPPYLRFTPSSPRILRDTTTDPARRAGLARVRKQREPDARAAVAQRDARPVHVGREGERLEAHGRAVGHGARARGCLDEGRRNESARSEERRVGKECRTGGAAEQ